MTIQVHYLFFGELLDILLIDAENVVCINCSFKFFRKLHTKSKFTEMWVM